MATEYNSMDMEEEGQHQHAEINAESPPDYYQRRPTTYENTRELYNKLTPEQKLEVNIYMNHIRGMDWTSFEDEKERVKKNNYDTFGDNEGEGIEQAKLEAYEAEREARLAKGKAVIQLGDTAKIRRTGLHKPNSFFISTITPIALPVNNRYFYKKLDPDQKKEMDGFVEEVKSLPSKDLHEVESAIREEIENSYGQDLDTTTVYKENLFNPKNSLKFI